MDIVENLNKRMALVYFKPKPDRSPIRTYAFYTTMSNLKLGDYVVVNCNNSFEIAIFYDYNIDIEDLNPDIKYMWIIQKVEYDKSKVKLGDD